MEDPAVGGVDAQEEQRSVASAELALAEAEAALARGQREDAFAGAAVALDCLIATQGSPGDPRVRAALEQAIEILTRRPDLPRIVAAREAVVRWDCEARIPRGAEDLDCIRAQEALIRVLGWSGQYARARELCEIVLAARRAFQPPDHPDILLDELRLASALNDLNDLDGARKLQERVLAVRERDLPADHRDIRAARTALSLTLVDLGDLRGALAIQERLLADCERLLPEDDEERIDIERRIAITYKQLGDLTRSRELEEHVIELVKRRYPEDVYRLAQIQQNLAVTLAMLGEFAAEREIEEQVLAVFERVLPPDHEEIQIARLNLTATLSSLGDIEGARRLGEQVLASRTRTLPAGHPRILSAQVNLALCMRDLGDFAGARELQERVLAAREASLPPDHLQTQHARLNLGHTLRVLGDIHSSRLLQEKALESLERTLPEKHADLQGARQELGITLRQLGESARARDIMRRAITALEETFSPAHPAVLLCKCNLAAALVDLGEIPEALEVLTEVCDLVRQTLPEEHPQVIRSDRNLALALWLSGELERSRDLMQSALDRMQQRLSGDDREVLDFHSMLALCLDDLGERAAAREHMVELARGARARIERTLWTTAPRECEAVALTSAEQAAALIAWTLKHSSPTPDPALVLPAFELVERLRSASLASTELLRVGRDIAGVSDSRTRAAAASESVARAARTGASDELARAIAERDLAEREIVSALQRDPRAAGLLAAPSATALARCMQPDTALVGFWSVAYLMGERRELESQRTVAFVLRQDASVRLFDLGDSRRIAAAVDAWRDALLAPIERGSSAASGANEDEAGEHLRALALDPLLPALDGASTIVIAPDDALHLVPFDALPLAASADAESRTRPRTGDRWRIQQRATLREILKPRAAAHPGGTLLARGGIDYESATGKERAPTKEPGGALVALARSGPWERGFGPLPATREEVRALAELFAERFPDAGPVLLLTGDRASRAALVELAPKASILHLATHGYFAPESIASRADAGRRARDDLLASADQQELVRGLSPMVLCGLALAGANGEPDMLGRIPGTLTAEELAALDLAHCELAVLSACDSNVGVRQDRAGQGVASLQRALQMAGARCVVTSLWKVPDEATRELMVDFYRRMWVQGKPKAQALWEAKKRLRSMRDENGQPRYATRDWAAWVLTGEPE